MAGLIQCPILVEPNSDFSFCVESNELSVDVKRSKILIEFLKGRGSLPQDVQNFSESKRSKITKSILDPFRVDIKEDILSTLAKMAGLFLLFLDSLDLEDRDKAMLIMLPHFVDLFLLVDAEPMIETNLSPLCDYSILPLKEVDSIFISEVSPVVARMLAIG